MNINSLDYDVLHGVFSIISNSCELEELVEISSVCRYWRTCLLPHLYKVVDIDNRWAGLKSKADLYCSSEYAKHARIMKFGLENIFIERDCFLSLLEETGITKHIWPNIKKIEIQASIEYHNAPDDPDDITEDEIFGVYEDRIVKEIGSLVSKHLPQLTEIECAQTVVCCSLCGFREYPCRLVPELVNRYSAQLKGVYLRVHPDGLSDGSFFPQHLTRLDIGMHQYETRMLPKVFAPSLQYLRIDQVSPDVTWSWFDSGNGDDVWFTSLTTLVVHFEFCTPSRLSYHNGDFRHVDVSSLKSDYRDASKLVHFPALKRLRVEYYPFTDDGFYDMFENSPLSEIDVDLSQRVGYRVSPHILSRIARWRMRIWYAQRELDSVSDGQDSMAFEKAVYEQAIADVMSTPTSAYSACLLLGFYRTVSLPNTLAWDLVRKLELGFYIDMNSACTVLAHMPSLQSFEFNMDESHLASMYKEGFDAGSGASQQPRLANRQVEYLFCRMYSEQPKVYLLYVLMNILPLVPSLMRLKVYPESVEVAKEIVSDPANQLGWMSGQLEIVGGKQA